MINLNLIQLAGNDGAEERLFALLKLLDLTYIPPISSMVDLPQYCNKLIENAEVVVANTDDTDIGFVAMYANDLSSRISFITSIGVALEYRGKGVGLALLNRAIFIAEQKGMQKIRLEVNLQNLTALGFYYGAGFTNPDSLSPASSKGFIVLERSIP